MMSRGWTMQVAHMPEIAPKKYGLMGLIILNKSVQMGCVSYSLSVILIY